MSERKKNVWKSREKTSSKWEFVRFHNFVSFFFCSPNKRNDFLSLNQFYVREKKHVLFNDGKKIVVTVHNVRIQSTFSNGYIISTSTHIPIFVCSVFFVSLFVCRSQCYTLSRWKKSHFHFHQRWHFLFNIFHLIALWLFHENATPNESLVVGAAAVVVFVVYVKLSS